MAEIEFHFFHGFLGNPSDWEFVVRELERQGVSACVLHNLSHDFTKLDKEKLSFASWAEQKTAQLNQSNRAKFLVGYSLGGRLAMHLPASCFNKALFIGSHPGLTEGKQARKISDEAWLHKLETLEPAEWLDKWNQQNVFLNDSVRPPRTLEHIGLVGEMLWRWSLARQEIQDEHLRAYAEQIFWCCGERDVKFSGLIPRMKSLLPDSHVFTIADSGHGVLFDQPERLAHEILRIADHVL